MEVLNLKGQLIRGQVKSLGDGFFEVILEGSCCRTVVILLPTEIAKESSKRIFERCCGNLMPVGSKRDWFETR